MTTILRPLTTLTLLGSLLLTGCQGLQGERDGDTYYSPAAAYSIDLTTNSFRGDVTLDERCDRFGGSTTFWDDNGRMFRIDYLRVEGNPNIRAPRFASDLTLLNLVLNAYLRGIVAEGPMINSAEVVHREFLQDTDPRALFTIVSLDVDSSRVDGSPDVSGNYYYGFMLFKKGQLVYLVQHRQPALMVDTMESVLLRMADAMEIPGKVRDDTEIERTRRILARLAPGETEGDPVRLCEPES
ncbi:MAG: hypothetical protein ACPG43_11155 [Alcanivoracaceae bacterium]